MEEDATEPDNLAIKVRLLYMAGAPDNLAIKVRLFYMAGAVKVLEMFSAVVNH